jgi:ABC-type transport system involved in cytochrome c biogenesis permease component
MHETLVRSHAAPAASPRAFGLMLIVVLAGLGFYPVLHDDVPRWWALALAIPALGLALIAPTVYSGLTRAWIRLGALLGIVVAPLALALLFFGVMTPMAWVLRVFRRDILGLSYDSAAPSYWVPRHPPGPEGASLKNPF